jgi:hypothetical protein
MALRLRWRIVCLLVGVAAVAAAQKPPAQSKQDVPPVRGAVRVQTRNGLFYVTNDVLLTVTRQDAWMIPKPGQVVSLDRKNSFTLRIISGETHLKASDLTSLMNEYLLPHAKAPIKNLIVTFDGDMIAMKGELHKGVDVPFEGKGTVSIGDPSDIRVHFTELKAAGILHKGFLDAFGIKLSQVAQPKKENRFHFEGDDIILPIEALFPPPRISGTLTAVRIEGDSLVQVFGDPGGELKDPPVAANEYIYFHGGRMQFGKLTMDDVDLELLNDKPAPQLDFSLDHYHEQLVSGYSKSLPNGGLAVYMPGYAMIAPHAKRE